jgi:hypothetical protein
MCFAVSCEKCAAELAEDSQFCRKCGHGFGVVPNGEAAKPPAPISAIPRRAYAFLVAVFWQKIEIEIWNSLIINIRQSHRTPRQHVFRLTNVRYHCDVNCKDTSERIAILMQEIRDLQENDAEFRKQNEYAHRTGRSAHDTRMLRLMQIKEELSRMMSTRSEHVS